MSQWHRTHPELTGTDADPWYQHDSYRKALPRILTDDERDEARLEAEEARWEDER